MSDELWNRQAEQFVLAGFLRNPNEYWSINDVGLVPSDFGSREARAVMAAIDAVASNKNTPDTVNVIEELRGAGKGSSEDYVSRLLSTPCSLAQAKDNARIVKGLSVSRRLQEVGVRAIEVAREARSDYEPALAEVEAEFADVRRGLPKSTSSAHPADIIADIKSRSGEPGIPIRFSPSLQYFTGGLTPGWLWVVGGFSSVGKSAVAVNFILDALQANNRWVGVISTEMPKESYVIRLLSAVSGVNQRSIREGVSLGSQEIDAIEGAEGLLKSANLRIHDTVYSLKGIRSTATRMKNMEGLDVLVVDFLQNVVDKGDEVADARNVIIGLQQLAKELNITVIAFSQISNAQAQYATNQENDQNYYSFKGHGAIRDAADVAIMLKRDQQGQSPMLNMQVVKNRHEQIGRIVCKMELTTGRITEYNADS